MRNLLLQLVKELCNCKIIYFVYIHYSTNCVNILIRTFSKGYKKNNEFDSRLQDYIAYLNN